jgi:hypothetical protein
MGEQCTQDWPERCARQAEEIRATMTERYKPVPPYHQLSIAQTEELRRRRSVAAFTEFSSAWVGRDGEQP